MKSKVWQSEMTSNAATAAASAQVSDAMTSAQDMIKASRMATEAAVKEAVRNETERIQRQMQIDQERAQLEKDSMVASLLTQNEKLMITIQTMHGNLAATQLKMQAQEANFKSLS